MCVMLIIDNKYISNIERDILKKTDIKDIIYINEYDDYYLVKDKENLYLFNSSYEEIYKVKIDLLYDNKNGYDIVYRDKTIMYMDNYCGDEGLVFKYYDIYTYDIIDEVVVGGK